MKKATETKTNLSANLLKMLPKKPNKSNLYGANKIVINGLCMLAAPIGISIIITMLCIFDGMGNALSISNMMGERMQGFVSAFNSISLEAAKPIAKVWATYISLFASVTLAIAILVTSLLGKETKGVSKSLTIISAIISFVGFEMFVIPPTGDIFEVFSHGFTWMQSAFALFLAAFPALSMYYLSEYLRNNYGDLIDTFNMEVTKRVVEDTEKEIKGDSKEDEQGNGMGKQNPFSAGNPFGNLSNFNQAV